MTRIEIWEIGRVTYVPNREEVTIAGYRRAANMTLRIMGFPENVITTQSALQARAVAKGLSAWGDSEILEEVICQKPSMVVTLCRTEEEILSDVTTTQAP